MTAHLLIHALLSLFGHLHALLKLRELLGGQSAVPTVVQEQCVVQGNAGILTGTRKGFHFSTRHVNVAGKTASKTPRTETFPCFCSTCSITHCALKDQKRDISLLLFNPFTATMSLENNPPQKKSNTHYSTISLYPTSLSLRLSLST